MDEIIQLCTSEGCIHIDATDKHWCPCKLILPNKEYYLGADNFETIRKRLLSALRSTWSELEDLDAGELDGHKVVWVLSLAEAHSVLYMAAGGEYKILMWKLDIKPSPITMQLSPEQESQWCKQLLMPELN